MEYIFLLVVVVLVVVVLVMVCSTYPYHRSNGLRTRPLEKKPFVVVVVVVV